MWCYNHCCGSASRWCGSGCGSVFWFIIWWESVSDISPWCGVDPDPDPSFKKGSNPRNSAKIGSYSIYIFWLDICKLMRIRIRFRNQLINFDADPDFYLMRIRMGIQVIKMMRIVADLAPQHWLQPLLYLDPSGWRWWGWSTWWGWWGWRCSGWRAAGPRSPVHTAHSMQQQWTKQIKFSTNFMNLDWLITN